MGPFHMTFLGRLISFFPLLNLALVFCAIYFFILQLNLQAALFVFATIYLFPLVCYRIHEFFFPLEEGVFDITSGYCHWYGAHMIQTIFIAFPGLERVLRLIPGCYSVWLRLWGSKIGKNVYWTPQLEVLDRGLIEVGNNCVFGFNIRMSSHYVNLSSTHGMMIYIKKIKFGHGSFIGTESRIAPGVIIEDEAIVSATSDLAPETIVRRRGPKQNNAKTSMK